MDPQAREPTHGSAPKETHEHADRLPRLPRPFAPRRRRRSAGRDGRLGVGRLSSRLLPLPALPAPLLPGRGAGSERLREVASRSLPNGLTREEFARGFSEHARLLWLVAAAHAPRGDAEDVLQEAALAALRRLDAFPPGGSFPAWMSQFVRFTAANARRVRKPADPAEAHPEAAARAPLPAAAVSTNGRLDADRAGLDDELLSALETLAPDARAALLLRVVLDLPVAEVAAALGLPENTVASHVHRARQALRERLAPPRAAARPSPGAIR